MKERIRDLWLFTLAIGYEDPGYSISARREYARRVVLKEVENLFNVYILDAEATDFIKNGIVPDVVKSFVPDEPSDDEVMAFIEELKKKRVDESVDQ